MFKVLLFISPFVFGLPSLVISTENKYWFFSEGSLDSLPHWLCLVKNRAQNLYVFDHGWFK